MRSDVVFPPPDAPTNPMKFPVATSEPQGS
jgi:hypothetical protein